MYIILNHKITKQLFGIWILLPSSGKGRGEEDRKPVETLVQPASRPGQVQVLTDVGYL
jgi:hypothetical protein